VVTRPELCQDGGLVAVQVVIYFHIGSMMIIETMGAQRAYLSTGGLN
jgi:hypothetical protein